MAEVNLLKAQSMFAKTQYADIPGSGTGTNPTFTVPTGRTIKIVKFHLSKLDAGTGSTEKVEIYIADTDKFIWTDNADEYSTAEVGTPNHGFILDNFFPITLAEGQFFKVTTGADAGNVQCWISYEEYSEDATVTSASGFTVS